MGNILNVLIVIVYFHEAKNVEISLFTSFQKACSISGLNVDDKRLCGKFPQSLQTLGFELFIVSQPHSWKGVIGIIGNYCHLLFK